MDRADRSAMSTEKHIIDASSPLARVNAFYMRRVLQRWARGEIDKSTAIELLHAAAFGDAVIPGRPAR